MRNIFKLTPVGVLSLLFLCFFINLSFANETTTLSPSSPPPSSSEVLSDPSNSLDPTDETPKLEKGEGHITEEEIHQIGKLFKIHPKRYPTLKKVGKKINSLIDRVHSNDGILRPEYLVHEFLPDPLPVKDIVVKEEEGFFTSYNGVFTHVLLHGTSKVKVTSIKANVGNFTAKILLHIPDVFLTGNYSLTGQVCSRISYDIFFIILLFCKGNICKRKW